MSTPMRAWIPVVALLLCVAPGDASTPQTWHTHGVDGWLATERDSIAVGSDGAVRLGLAREPLGDEFRALTVWSLLFDGSDVLVATGDGGSVYRIGPGGEVGDVVTVIQPEITSLGRDRRGDVVMGAAPDGHVYRIEGAETALVADLPETYIWDLKPGPDGTLLAATGHRGGIYRLKEQPERWVEVPAQHVTGLLVEGDDVYATTDSPGQLLKIRDDGSYEVLHEGTEPELRDPVLGADGNLYFLANPEDETAGGRLYRRIATGAVDLVWSAPRGYAYHLERADDGALWIGTGGAAGRGAVVRVEPGPPTTWSEPFSCAEPQVTSFLLRDNRPAWVGTGSLGRVYRIPGPAAPDGRVRSTVLDAGSPARWGAISVEPGPDASGIGLATRSGNTRTPGDSWSDWESVSFRGRAGVVSSPSARYLQWRLQLDNDEVGVSGVRVAYLPANRAPRIQSVVVSPLGARLERSSDQMPFGGVSQALPGVRVEFQMSNGQAPGPASDEEAAWARRFRTVTWQSSDPDGDDLAYEVTLRQAGETQWHDLADELERSPWVWDSATVPDGWYEVQLIASDAGANPPSSSLQAGHVSTAFLVDNTPPRVLDLAFSGGAVTGAADDASSPLRALDAAVDGGEWRRVFPEDGIPDSPRETFRIDPGTLEPGDHVILVRAVDEGGNIGTGRLRFVVEER